MRKITLLAAIALTVSALSSCKTNEENYRKAYEAAKQRESEGLEETVYDRIRREARPVTSVVGNDTLQMKREYVSLAPDQQLAASALKRYNVVVAQFKQIFHARSMTRRFSEGGYDGAFIVQTREPLYYVVAFASDDASAAADAMKALQKESPVTLRDPFPWILYPSNR